MKTVIENGRTIDTLSENDENYYLIVCAAIQLKDLTERYGQQISEMRTTGRFNGKQYTITFTEESVQEGGAA